MYPYSFGKKSQDSPSDRYSTGRALYSDVTEPTEPLYKYQTPQKTSKGRREDCDERISPVLFSDRMDTGGFSPSKREIIHLTASDEATIISRSLRHSELEIPDSRWRQILSQGIVTKGNPRLQVMIRNGEEESQFAAPLQSDYELTNSKAEESNFKNNEGRKIEESENGKAPTFGKISMSSGQ